MSTQPLAELHHVKAAGLVRGADTLLSLAELEYEEREGNSRPSVLDAITERAVELAAELDDAGRVNQLAIVVDGVGESPERVVGVLRGASASTDPAMEAPASAEPAMEATASTEGDASASTEGEAPVEAEPAVEASPSAEPLREASASAEPATEASASTEPAKKAREPGSTNRPGRALIGPQVRVRGEEGDTLVPTTELWRRR